VRSTFCSQARHNKRRAGAVLAIVALLLQAIVLAWHHHALVFASRHAPDLAGLAVIASPDPPPVADHDCQICFALVHHGAVPVDFFAPAQPAAHTSRRLRTAAILVSLPAYLLFQPRAPPQA
jgi:hypothetical protein